MTAKILTVVISGVVLVGLVFGMVVMAGPVAPPVVDDPWSGVPEWPKATDHTPFFDEQFADGPSVTRACLECHPDSAEQVMATTHWTWLGSAGGDVPGKGPIPLGKQNVLNNFCIAISANWPRCTSCHAGYGYEDASFFETAGPDQVDCLICHDSSGLYEKGAALSGHPSPSSDLLASARSVGRTTRTGCGNCHFRGGGGDGVKHGDLDGSMFFPPERVDVHMGRHALVCSDCHQAHEHRIEGRFLPEQSEYETRATCTSCHAEAPHTQDRLNTHVTAVACQTCHIPLFAVETGTKMWWDWSLAGRDGDPAAIAAELVAEITTVGMEGYSEEIVEGFRRVDSDPDVHATYSKAKGLFLVARRQIPEYGWYNGTTSRYAPGERFDGEPPLQLNRPQGSASDPEAKIWPFKVHRGIQPFDGEYRHLLALHTYGEGGYWTEFDWDRALEVGAEAAGVPFSGQRSWISTEMYWPQNHMVASADNALRCVDCHGATGRMDWAALGYPSDPAYGGDRRQMDLVREGGS
jgi:octaheme c-type cytochrome (tetrathionate reductase family)